MTDIQIIGSAVIALLVLILMQLLGIRKHLALIERRGRPNLSYFDPPDQSAD